MKKIITTCLLFLLMGCSNDDEIKNEPNEPPIAQPIPEGAKEVTIIVDEPYDLKDTEAQSLMDSSPMDGETNKIAVPNNFES